MDVRRLCFLRGSWAVLALLLTLMVAATSGQNSLFLNSGGEAARVGMSGSGAVGRGAPAPKANIPMVLADEVGRSTRQADSVLSASWISVEAPRPKNFRVHDLVTIIVNEVSRHASKGGTDTSREYDVDASLNEWFRLTGGALRLATSQHGDPALKFGLGREFDGSGAATRSDSLTARIRAEVVDVLPNGNLVLEANHSVTTDDETVLITLTGICAATDLGQDNTILSSQLARLDVRKTHTGQIRDATRRGIFSSLLEFINPF